MGWYYEGYRYMDVVNNLPRKRVATKVMPREYHLRSISRDTIDDQLRYYGKIVLQYGD